jgi:hypothetical protein
MSTEPHRCPPPEIAGANPSHLLTGMRTDTLSELPANLSKIGRGSGLSGFPASHQKLGEVFARVAAPG